MRMRTPRARLALVLLLLLHQTAAPCTVFLAARGQVVLAGNNEDYTDKNTKVWFHPADDDSFGRVYFGFGNGFPQGGLNDQGLFFDGLSLDTKNEAAPGREVFDGNLMDRVMRECTTVKEAVQLFERYDFPTLASGQLFLGDASGDSAIVERKSIIRRDADYQIATNFNQSLIKPTDATCPRYRKANSMLRSSGKLDVDVMRNVLDAVHQEITVYSQVYDLTNRDVYLYLEHDFKHPVKFNLDEELKKGKRELVLLDYFKSMSAEQSTESAR